MQIPIQNIYYLLCYAWNKLDEKDKVNVSTDGCTELVDLFAKVLANGARILLKRGIDRSYVDRTDEIAGVKGKLQAADTVKRNLLLKQRTVCSFDEFSPDILPNRILVTTLRRLLTIKQLNSDIKDEIRSLILMFPDISSIPLSHSVFKAVRLNRNNKFYGFLINVCEIIFDNMLPSEENGVFSFIDFTRDENKMNRLFEEFVRNFYKLEQRKFPKVRREYIQWQFNSDILGKRYLPGMETDITLENETDKIIIDAKYYRETVASYYDKQMIHPANLYQIFSYLLNQEDGSNKCREATGILLYPTVENEYDLNYQYRDHSIRMLTVNLNQDWKLIARRLLTICESN